jgi:hypothetical protein
MELQGRHGTVEAMQELDASLCLLDIQSEDGMSQTRLKAADRECPGRGTSVR